MSKISFSAVAAAVVLTLGGCGGGGSSSTSGGTTGPVQVGITAELCAAGGGAYSASWSSCIRAIGVRTVLSTATVPASAGMPAVGQPLPAAWLPRIDADDITIADTGITVSGNAALILGYNDESHTGRVALYDKVSGKLVAVATLSGELVAVTGNPTGAAISVASAGSSKTFVVTFDGTNLVSVCRVGC